jgi:anti-anti-sigma regulatory factor
MTQLDQEASLQADAVRLPGELTIAQSGEFYQRFAELVEQGRDIVLDGSDVSRIDASFIQLLYQVQRALAETSHSLKWVNTSEAITRSVKLLGMDEQLALADAG